MHNKMIAAVDFGSSKLSASLGKFEEEEVNILGTSFLPSKGIEKGFITDEVKCGKALKNLLNKLEDKTKVLIKEVYAGVSTRGLRIVEVNPSIKLKESKVFIKHTRWAIEKSKRLVNILDGEEVVDTIINYYSLDDKISDDVVGCIGNNLKVNITVVLGPSVELNKFKKIILDNGYIFKGFKVNILCGRKIFLDEKNYMESKVLIDIGGGTSDFALFNNGTLKYMGNIPLGGNNVTKDLSICGEFSMGEAENVKLIYANNYETMYNDESIDEFVNIGASKISKTLFYEVTKARLEELFNMVNSGLKNSSYYQGICSIIIYGDGISYYQNISNLVKNEFEKKAKVITKDDLGMKNSFNITSLAIVKDVFDIMKLLSKSSTEVEGKNDKKYLLNDMDDKKSFEKTKGGVFFKLKSFLGDIF
ncbi:ethanolamine ammonia-lyase reactivating factor EutA [Clostridium sp. SHJSY1]|uniref:cell division FtsA domain-containing protein n=1 Tax=Clostridium sp. SHJSY1 TaxID=2942483 RepID=UPI002875D735|nr:cell division FtsA domain-containing protein [Clostridium sp. SHJSY1]MDS0524973.1 ethanolamine ammonia-lyase reactivating factor EutA [Clostridium sp. SHJSY1]